MPGTQNGISPFWTGPSPRIDEVIKAILTDRRAGWCRWRNPQARGSLVEPHEWWLPSIGVWVRCDGFSYNGDYGREYAYPSWIGRLRIRMAIRQRIKHGPPVE